MADDDNLDGCGLDFTKAPQTTSDELENLLVPAGEEEDEEE